MNDTKVLAIVMVLAACLGLAWLYRPVVLNGVMLPSCLIRDLRSTTIRLYVADGEVWQQLQTMKEQHLHKWIGGKLLRDTPSVLGFRFDSGNLIVADFTIETYQTWLLDISGRLEYWLSVGVAVVWAEVVDQPDGYVPT